MQLQHEQVEKIIFKNTKVYIVACKGNNSNTRITTALQILITALQILITNKIKKRNMIHNLFLSVKKSNNNCHR